MFNCPASTRWIINCALAHYRILKELELLQEAPLVKLLSFLMKSASWPYEDDFLTIQWKMDMIDQKLADLYRNWQAEYRNAVTSEDCEEVNYSTNHIWKSTCLNIESSMKCYNRPIDK